MQRLVRLRYWGIYSLADLKSKSILQESLQLKAELLENLKFEKVYVEQLKGIKIKPK